MRRIVTLLLLGLAVASHAAPVITGVVPPSASPGMPVVLVGSGFSDVPTSNVVRFGGVAALVGYPASENVLVATVPSGAVSGTVSVEVASEIDTVAFVVNAPASFPGNAVNLQTVEGTYDADLAVQSSLLPHVQIVLDAALMGGITSVAVLRVRPEATAPDDITSLFTLHDLQLDDDADVALDEGTNLILVAVNGAVSFAAQLLAFTPDTLVTMAGHDPDLATTAGSLTYQSHTLLVDLVDTATDRSISERLQIEDLAPIGLVQDVFAAERGKVVVVDTRFRPEDPAGIEAGFNTSPPAEVEGAVVNLYPDEEAPAAEALPARLLNGGPNGAGATGGDMNSAYVAITGRFDNDGSVVAAGDPGGIGVQGTPSDELDRFWQHFFMQTFAAHRLRDVLYAAAPAANRAPAAGLVIHDFGFGNGGATATTNPVLTDLPVARLGVGADPATPPASFDGINYSTAVRRPRRITGLADSPAPNDHGTYVALTAAGSGARTELGTGRDANVFIYQVTGPLSADAAALRDAAGRSDVDVVNMSAGWSIAGKALTAARQKTINGTLGPALAAIDTAGQIFVKSAGNRNTAVGDSIPGNLAPARGGRHAAGALARMVVVGATNVVNRPIGPESRWTGSDSGTRVHVTAPGGPQLVVTQDDGRIISGQAGTSWSAPKVAGLLAEMIQLDETMNGVPANAAALRTRRLRMVETVEGTADDLGTTGAAGLPNDNPGDGADNHFGHGRINAWKAMLSTANGGLAAQPGRTAAGGTDSQFKSLPLKDDAATTWYGFEIVTAERQATVWIDGTKLADTGSAVPLTPDVTAYKGVRSDARSQRGVPGEDPTLGIVAAGTGVNDRGEFVMTFSIPRTDLYEPGGAARTLSLRRRGAAVTDQPLFNLRLETAKMRTEEVTGVVFDDFVFQITPPDYGDAGIGPTTLAENGARHLNSTLEWLGRLGASNLKSVSPEHNAEAASEGGDARVDVDGVPNRQGLGDLDGRDDGVVFFPLTYVPGPGTPGKVRFTVGVHDPGAARYANDPDRSLYVNLWIDWNTNFGWSENEHVLNGVRLVPRPTGWLVADQGTSGSVTTLVQEDAGKLTATFESAIPVGANGCGGTIDARMRLDYGEDVGRNDPRPLFVSLPSLRPAAGPPGLTAGAARYGEVEDYEFGTDFGDAQDAGGRYPTLAGFQGARHLAYQHEWLGPFSVIPPASHEVDANDPGCGAGGGTDHDSVPNLNAENTDGNDDGVRITPFQPGGVAVIEVTVGTQVSLRGAAVGTAGAGTPEDPADGLPRYDATSPERRLYLSGWADWDGDRDWDPDEEIIHDVIDPATFGADGRYNLGEPFTDTNLNGVRDAGEPFTDVFGTNSKAFVYSVPVPDSISAGFYYRFRLALGEDGATVDLPLKECDEEARVNLGPGGGALFGEVEDYPFRPSTLGYKTRLSRNSPKFAGAVVNVLNTFEFGTFAVKKPKTLSPAPSSVPVSLVGLEGFKIKANQALFRQVGIQVADTFGRLSLDTVKADLLLVPSGIDQNAAPPEPNPTDHVVDTYACYKVKETRGTPKFPRGVQTLFDDEFTLVPKVFDVKKLRHLCVPTDVNGGGVKDSSALLTCYQVKPAAGEPKHTRVLGIGVNNALSLGLRDTKKEDEICVPALRNPPVPEL